MTFIFLKEEC